MDQDAFRPRQFKVLPTIIKNLLIINGVFYLAIFALGSMNIDITDKLGLHYIQGGKFNPFQLVTYMFLHDKNNIGHILMNMFALWMFGNILENVWGPKRFLIYYLLTGIGAAVAQTIVMYFQLTPVVNEINGLMANHSAVISPQTASYLHDYFVSSSTSPTFENLPNAIQGIYDLPVTVGASGAVFGILLAFGMLFPNSLVYLFFAIPIKAKYVVIGYAAFELFYGVSGSRDGVAHFAHLGGMVVGILLILYWRKTAKTLY